MSVVVLALLFVVIVAVAGAMVVMLIKDEPFYGAMGLCLLIGLGTVLTFLYVALTPS
jgi:hypothetical protein